MILLDMSKRSNRWSVYTSDDLFSTKEVIPTSYDKITYNVTSSSIIYSIAETAKANNLKPYEYFEYLLTKIPAHAVVTIWNDTKAKSYGKLNRTETRALSGRYQGVLLL